MITQLDTLVSVEAYFDQAKRLFAPQRLVWSGREFKVSKLGLRHSYRQGRTLYHVFSLVAGQLFFRLELNTEALTWVLKEVSDGQPN